MLLAALVVASIGRFSGGPPFQLTSFDVSGLGFRFLGGGGTEFQFDSTGLGYFAGPATATEKNLLVPAGPSGARKLRLYLTIPAFDAQFGDEMDVMIKGAAKGFITWTAGSVGEGVPADTTADWHIVTFAPSSNVLGIRFSQPPDRLELIPRGGGLTLRAIRKGGLGWVRFMAPLGCTLRVSNDASSLGSILRDVGPAMSFLAACKPINIDPVVTFDAQSMRVRVIHRNNDKGQSIPPIVSVLVEAVILKVGAPDGDHRFVDSSAHGFTLPVPAAKLVPTKHDERTPPKTDLSLASVLGVYEMRSILADEEYGRLRLRLATLAKRLVAEWEEWTEPQSQHKMWRLVGASGEDSLLRHAQSARVLVAAMDMGAQADSFAVRQAAARFVPFFSACLDWATFWPYWKGVAVTKETAEVMLSAALDLRRLFPTDIELAYVAARLAEALRTGPRGALPRFDAPPLGRIKRAVALDYESSRTLAVTVVAGAAFTVKGDTDRSLQRVTLDGKPMTFTLRLGRFSVALPSLSTTSTLELRFGPAK